MNNQLLGSKAVQVMIAQRKQDRIEQLTTDYIQRNKKEPASSPLLEDVLKRRLEHVLNKMENLSQNS